MSFVSLHLLMFVFILLQPCIGSSPSEFINDISNYQGACRAIGWRPRNDCSIYTDTNVIAFHANLNANSNNLSTNTTIRFENVLLNKGNGYDPNTGIFTAPEDGVYSFAWSFLSNRGGTVYIAAVVDHVDRVYTCINNQQSTYINTSGHLLYELKKGSKVWLRTFHVVATFVHGTSYTYFSGHRINSFQFFQFDVQNIAYF